MKLYRGVVENNQDPTHTGKVQVRIFGINTINSSTVGTSDLPWAEVMGGTDFGLISGVGISSVLHQGTWVYVTLDDDDINRPIVLGVVHGIARNMKGNGFKDPSGEFPKQDRLGKSDFSDTITQEYGKVQTLETSSGHQIILNDGQKPSIIIKHCTGTTITIDETGQLIVNGVKGATYTFKEDVNLTTEANVNIKCAECTIDAPTTHLTGDQVIDGTSTANDHISSGISGKGHTHSYHHGETSSPH